MNRWLKLGLLSLMVLAFLTLLFPFHAEILLAGIFAFALDPLARFLTSRAWIQKSKINFRRRQWVTLILIFLFALIVLPVGFAFYNVYGTLSQATANGLQNTEFYQDLSKLKGTVIPQLESVVETLNLKKQIDLTALSDKAINDAGQKFLSWVANFASRLPDLIVFVFVFVCALYYFLAEHRHLRSGILKSQLIDPQELDRIVRIFQKTCSNTILASVFTGLIQASLVAIGSLILKTGDVLLIFVLTFFLSFIPVVGAAPVALLLGILAMVKSDFGTALGFAVVAVIVGSIDNLIRPFLASGVEDAHPIVILIGLLGAIVIFGLPGLFLGPVIASVTVQLIRAYLLES